MQPLLVVDMQKTGHPLEKPVLVRTGRRDGQAGGATQSGPRLAGVDGRRLTARSVEVVGERQVPVAPDVLDQLRSAHCDLGLDVVQYQLPRDPVEPDRAARGQEREAVLDLAHQLRTGTSGQRAVANVPAEAPVVLSHEVEHGQAGLAGGAAQAPAQLLQEDGGALGGAQEQHGVDLGHVDALVEQVDREDGVDLSVTQVTKGGRPGLGIGAGVDGHGGYACLVEHPGHVVGLIDRDAEPESSHGADVGDDLPQAADDDGGPGVVAGVEVGEAGHVVGARRQPMPRRSVLSAIPN
jgi:hypothetical protein